MIKPTGGLVLIQPEEIKDQTTSSGLVISAAFRETGLRNGEIIAMGNGEPNALNGDLIPMTEFNVGDIVLFPDHSGHNVEEGGNRYILMHHKNILGVVQ